MATQYSNKPIVTDGLVYALDFGNPKSYVSGSSTASSLKFGSVTGSILTFGGASIPNLQNGLLKMVAPTSTTGSTIDTLQQFSDLIPTGDFTIQIIISGSSNAFITQGPSGTRVISTLSSTTGMFGWYINPVPYGGDTLYKTKTAAINPGLQHLTYRYSSGSYDLFVNGIPSPITSRGQTTSTNTGNLTINGRGSAASLSTQDLGNFYIYNRALTSDEIYSNYLIQAQRYGLPTIPKPYTIDENAFLFLSQSGITDPIITSSIDTFVKGLKSTSLWDKMIAIYPFVGTGSVGVNLTGSQSWNLKEPTSAFYRLSYTGSWNGSTSGSTPSGSNTSINTGVLPFEYYPFKSDSNQHFSILSYDTPVSRSYLMGTGMTEDLAVSTLAGDYGTPAAAYSVRKVRTAYTGALMDVRRSYDNVTSSIGFVSNGDLDTGSLLDWVSPGRSTLPGAYSGLAAAYSLRRVSASYAGSVIDVRRDSDNTTGSVGFDINGNLDTGSLLAFVTGSAGTGSGFVAQWYDQSGNNRHATQTATGSQPLIVSSGSLVTKNGKPAVSFNGTSNKLVAPLVSTSTEASFIVVTTGGGGVFTNGYSFGYGFLAQTKYDLVALNVAFNPSTENALTNTQSLAFGYVKPNTTRQLYVNNTQYTIITSSSINTPNISTTIGAWDQYPGWFNGTIQELAIYDGNLTGSRALIENNINNYYNIYTGSNHGFVARWYDQSGNNIHVSQSATGSQPLIVLSGSVISDNSTIGIYFDGNTFLQRGAINVTQVGQYTVYTPYGDTRYNVWGQSIGDAYWLFNGTTGYIDLFGGANTNNRREAYPTGVPSSGPTLFSSFHEGNNMTTFINNSNRGTDSTQPFSATGDVFIGTQKSGVATYSLSGSIKEIIVYNSANISNREPIEYGINDYYNIYPQTSSFATSSFTISAASGSVSASLNNRLTSGIASSGPLGLITVSRTGSNSLTIARNGVTSSFTVPASGALSTGIYLGAINNNGIALGNSPLNISFASVGTGLTNSELGVYYNLVDGLNFRLGKGVNSEYTALLSYATSLGYTLPSSTQRIYQNRLITQLKQFGIWDKLDAFYLFATDGDQNIACLNWKNLGANTISLVNGPLFTANQGFIGNGSNSYLDTNFIPATHGVNYKLNDASRSVWVYTANSSTVLTALSDGQSERTNNFSSNRTTINSGTNRNGTGDGSGTGLMSAYRASSATAFLYNNNTAYDLATASTVLAASSIRLIITGGLSRISMFSMGASLISENPNYINTIQAYLNSISS